MSESFLANIQQEGIPLIQPENSGEQEKETPADSPADNNQVDNSPSPQGGEVAPKEPSNTEDESNVPLHKNPRWIERENEWKNRFSEFETRLRSEMDERFTKVAQPAQDKPSIPQEFADLFGDNPDAWEKWDALTKRQQESWEQSFIEKQRKAEEAKHQESKRWEDWRVSSIRKLEDTHGVKLAEGSSELNELMKITLDYQPTDEEGNISFEKGYDLMLKLRKDVNADRSKARKSLAAATASDSKAESAPAEFYTSKDLRRGWRQNI